MKEINDKSKELSITVGKYSTKDKDGKIVMHKPNSTAPIRL